MIKKLQALKAKKGFTLVELVVVIAIIGVLAAILVPTMIGVVQDSNITSANSTASQIKTQTTTFLTKADAAHYSVRGTDSMVTLSCTISEGTWTISSSSSDFRFGDGAGTWKVTGSDVNTCLDAYLGDVLRDFRNGYVEIYIEAAAVIGVAAVPGGVADDIPDDLKTDATWYNTQSINWPGSKAGVGSDSVIIGTAPVIAHSSSTGSGGSST